MTTNDGISDDKVVIFCFQCTFWMVCHPCPVLGRGYRHICMKPNIFLWLNSDDRKNPNFLIGELARIYTKSKRYKIKDIRVHQCPSMACKHLYESTDNNKTWSKSERCRYRKAISLLQMVGVRGTESGDFFVPCDLEIWRAPLLRHFKLHASFRTHLWIQTGVKIRKCLNWGKFVLNSVTLTFVFWPWPSPWTTL